MTSPHGVGTVNLVNPKSLPRAAERIVGAQGKCKNGTHTVGGGGGGGGGGSGCTPPENVEILHALKCVLRASQVPY